MDYEYIIEKYLVKIDESLNTMEYQILHGAVCNHEEYRYTLGKIEGYRESINLIKELLTHKE
jgi:hypothetical protein